MRKSSALLLTLCLHLQFAGIALARPVFEVVKYGPHQRQYFYVYHAQGWFKPWLAAEAHPAMVYFHGGGFVGGGPEFGPLWWHLFFNEVTVVAPAYRLTSDNVTKREILEDGARVVQFLRLNASTYNIDPDRIGVGGFSAGGVIAAWLALHDDIADPLNSDPVRRQSSRTSVAYLYYTQVHPRTLDDWQSFTGAARDLLNRTVFAYTRTQLNGSIFKKPFTVAQFASQTEYEAALAAYERDTSPFDHASADDPPVGFLTWESPEPAQYLKNWYDATGLHSPLLMIPLNKRLERLNVSTYWGWLPAIQDFVLEPLE